MAGWARAPMDRRQVVLFSTTLDDRIPPDHPVRLFDEILAGRDWRSWESHYVLVQGQPPIHPRVVAAAILYGLSQGIRSSRRLEWACGNALDFLWLVEGRGIDHSTFCEFRTRFGKELKDLFRQIGRLAMAMGMIQLNQVALDGTKVKANSSRSATASASTLEHRLAALDEQIEKMFAEAQQADRREEDLFADAPGPTHLPRELANLKRRQERLREALAAAKEKDAADGKRHPVPVADPQSSVAPNKEGGHAPNYTPTAAVDGAQGLIVDAEVLDGHDEAGATVPTVDRVEETLGRRPAALLADGAFASGPNLAGLRQRDVEAYVPQEQREDRPDNPARRADLSAPVSAGDWEKLPRNDRTKRLARSAFVYQAERDCYWCPMGKAMPFVRRHTKGRRRRSVTYREYRCAGCGGCPRRASCVPEGSEARTIHRDAYEPLREAMDRRMGSDAGRAVYRRRAWLAETPLAVLKAWMGLRQFLLRGLEKVRTEWRWACTAYNLKKMAHALALLRGSGAARAG